VQEQRDPLPAPLAGAGGKQYPLIAPGLVATSIFAFITSWNEYIFARVLLNDGSKQTITVWLSYFLGTSRQTDWGALMAGSTLTAAILRQNPRFHAGMSSPVAALFDHLIAQVSAGSELSTMVSEPQRARLLRGLFDSYYAGYAQPVIFDTNRAWTAQLPALMRLFPDAKIICCVRDVAWVMDSLERQYRNNAFEHTRLFNNPAERGTVYTRVEALANANRLVVHEFPSLEAVEAWVEDVKANREQLHTLGDLTIISVPAI